MKKKLYITLLLVVCLAATALCGCGEKLPVVGEAGSRIRFEPTGGGQFMLLDQNGNLYSWGYTEGLGAIDRSEGAEGKLSRITTYLCCSAPMLRTLNRI